MRRSHPQSGRLPTEPFTVSDALALGISRATLYRMVERGALDHLGPGLFQLPGSGGDDAELIEAVSRAPRATICLGSALAHHGLVDSIPSALDLALPRRSYLPRASSVIRWHSFDAATFDVGRSEIELQGSRRRVGLYEPARAICDVLRLRGLEGYEIGVEALRNWLTRRGASPAALMTMADQLPRARGPVRTALEYLA